MNKHKVLGSTFAGLILAGFISQSAYANTSLVMNTFFPPGHFFTQTMHEWAGQVEEKTQGRVTIDIPAGGLTNASQQLSSVRSGIADISVTANVHIHSQAPLMSFSSLPFQIQDAEAASIASWLTYQEFLADSSPLESMGVHTLSVFNLSGGYLYGVQEDPIETVEELRRARLWTLPGFTTDTLVNADISPVTSPAVEVGEYVARSVVDAVYGITHESMTDFKASAYLKNIVEFPLAATSTSFSMVINPRVWSRIDERDQEILEELTGEHLARMVGAAAQEAADNALKEMTENDGIPVYAATDELYEALKQASEPLYESFFQQAEDAGVDGEALLERFRDEYRGAKEKL
jgi:TRAP-type transport system periplasmic protein